MRPMAGDGSRHPGRPRRPPDVEGSGRRGPRVRHEVRQPLGAGGGEKGIINSVQLEFGKLLRGLGFARGKGLSFYSLRHTFRTVADATRDFPAVRLVMGNADETIDGVYRERIDDTRLAAIAEYVRAWLFGKNPGLMPAATAQGSAESS